MVSQAEFPQFADHVRAQNETIRLVREHLDEAGKRMIELEKEKSKKSKHGHIQFGKDFCPDPYDGRNAAAFKN